MREYGGAAPSRQPGTGCGGSGRDGNLVLRRERGCLREGVARWHGCRRNPVRTGLLAGGELPAEASELAGDRDGDDPVALATGVFELAPAGVQPSR